MIKSRNALIEQLEFKRVVYSCIVRVHTLQYNKQNITPS